MASLIILILLNVFLYIWLKAILYKNFNAQKNNYQTLKNEYDKLSSENSSLRQDSCNFKNTLEQVTAIYNTTKQICKSLERDKVFSYFKEEIAKHISVGNCEWLAGDADLSAYKGYTVLPLRAGDSLIGYLAAGGIRQEDEDSFRILGQQFLLGIKRALLYQRLQELSITDSLTGVFSRRYYLERFKEEMERSRKFNYHLSCLIIDIDHFKDCNDRYGHLVGDAVLKEVSKTIKENIRQIDLICRYGGEEFSLILAGTDKERARFAAERIREAIANRLIRVYDEDLKATVSVGISTFPEDGNVLDQLIDNADAALYQAKEAGRNKVCPYKP